MREPEGLGRCISILAVLADRDDAFRYAHRLLEYFNPRGPCGPRRPTGSIWVVDENDFNPRGPCGPRLLTIFLISANVYISILAVLADRDPAVTSALGTVLISILAVLADRDAAS